MNNFFDLFKSSSGGTGSRLGSGGSGGNAQQGRTLGGSLPGQVIHIELTEPGPLGVKVEKRPNSQGTAIVAQVVEQSQAARAGLQRGDILCFAGSNGTEEIMYDMFIELAQSDRRPLCFEVRRIPTANSKSRPSQGGASGAAPAGGLPSQATTSAEAYARKQAVIAAAERREKAHQAKTKPLPKKDPLPVILTTAERLRLEKEANMRQAQFGAAEEPRSEEARRAREIIKQAESEAAAQLGYNPYETNRATAGQARTATVAMKHGTLQAEDGDRTKAPSTQGGSSLPRVRSPTDPSALRSTAQDQEVTLATISPQFRQAFETMVTSHEDQVQVMASLGIIRKLVINATTKGQPLNPDDNGTTADEAAKFRRVRLANPKIQQALVEVDGALDLMLAFGFQLQTEEATGESVLVYPPGEPGPNWMPSALQWLENYEKSVPN